MAQILRNAPGVGRVNAFGGSNQGRLEMRGPRRLKAMRWRHQPSVGTVCEVLALGKVLGLQVKVVGHLEQTGRPLRTGAD